MGIYDLIVHHLSVFKAFMVLWLGWGFGFSVGIIFAVITLFKDKMQDWYEEHDQDD